MAKNSTDYVFLTTDPDDNVVYLSNQRWDYITNKHPELHGEEQEIKATIIKPDSIYVDKDYRNTFCYYRQHNATQLRIYGTKLKVIVDREAQGAIKTAYVTDRIKEKSGKIYPKIRSK